MIKNLIFDLGGVILNIDFSKSIEEFRKLGITNIDELFSRYSQSKLFDMFEKGNISEKEFIANLKKTIEKPVTNNQIYNAWNAMLLDFPMDRIELLKELNKKYRIFLLSNTNVIHNSVYNELLNKKYGINDLTMLFEEAYYSFKLHMRKPDKEIFEYVLKGSKLNEEETVFIDDSPVNIKTAEKLGMKVVLYNPEDSLKDVLLENKIQ
ncbi:MAG TPA: HAD family phosphatase [Bacteroidales bacterium]|nr:HAD family phosphatase [Bacteroidales bacterium]HPS16499.1 HAD family phosphatase [Bacteroidales bacterium]